MREFRYEYNKEFVINKVKRLCKGRLLKYIVNLIMEDARLSNIVRDYLKKEIFKTNSYLMMEDFIYDEYIVIESNEKKL